MDDRTRTKLRHASAYASERYTISGRFKEHHAPRAITLATLESKRKLDQEIFGEECQGTVRDRHPRESRDIER